MESLPADSDDFRYVELESEDGKSIRCKIEYVFHDGREFASDLNKKFGVERLNPDEFVHSYIDFLVETIYYRDEDIEYMRTSESWNTRSYNSILAQVFFEELIQSISAKRTNSAFEGEYASFKPGENFIKLSFPFVHFSRRRKRAQSRKRYCIEERNAAKLAMQLQIAISDANVSSFLRISTGDSHFIPYNYSVSREGLKIRKKKN